MCWYKYVKQCSTKSVCKEGIIYSKCFVIILLSTFAIQQVALYHLLIRLQSSKSEKGYRLVSSLIGGDLQIESSNEKESNRSFTVAYESWLNEVVDIYDYTNRHSNSVSENGQDISSKSSAADASFILGFSTGHSGSTTVHKHLEDKCNKEEREL